MVTAAAREASGERATTTAHTSGGSSPRGGRSGRRERLTEKRRIGVAGVAVSHTATSPSCPAVKSLVPFVARSKAVRASRWGFDTRTVSDRVATSSSSTSRSHMTASRSRAIEAQREAAAHRHGGHLRPHDRPGALVRSP